MHIICVDVGTHSVKAALFDGEGGRLESASLPCPAVTRADGPCHEADPLVWSSTAESLVASLASRAGGEVKAICVSGNGPSLVLARRAGDGIEALAPALFWPDSRATAETARIRETLGYEIDPTFYLPKALWFLGNRGEARLPGAFVLPAPDYVASRLCDIPHASIPSSGYARWFWDGAAIDSLGAPATFFAPLKNAGDIVGAVSPSAASRLGIRTECLIVAGLPDFLAAQAGADCLEPGKIFDRTGSSEALNLCSRLRAANPALLTLPHLVPGLWNLSGGVSTSGSALEWFRRLSDMDKDISSIDDIDMPDPSRPLFLPYLSGERAPLWNHGLKASFAGIATRHSREDLFKAILESVCLALREVLDLLDAESAAGREKGYPSAQAPVVLSGGLAVFPALNRLKADILGRSLVLPAHHECELEGSAALAMTALGVFADLPSAARSLFRESARFEPRPEHAAFCAERFGAFIRAREGSR